jgi:hypothetical protein
MACVPNFTQRDLPGHQKTLGRRKHLFKKVNSLALSKLKEEGAGELLGK